MKKYCIGLVGVHRGSGLAYPFTVFPETEIAALCDLDERRLAEAGEHFNVPDRFLFTDYETFLEAPIDIVVVGTPMPFHVEQSVKAMESGKHVLSEVTAATTLEDCERLVEAVKRTGQLYMMAENSCYKHFIQQWKGWIEQGRLGKIFYAEAEYIHEIHNLLWDEKTGKTFWRVDRPPIYYCSHSLGPLLYLMEDRIIKACGAHSGFDILPADLGIGCLNMEVALFKTQKGAVIKILRSQVAYREPRMHYYSLYGTKGFLENDRGREETGKLYIEGEMSRQEGYQVIDCPTSDPEAPPEALGGGHGTTEYYLVRDFIEAVDKGTRPPIDVIRAMDFTVPGICAHQSAMNDGKWVDVPLFDW
jgi:predicted dehydrogenase